MTTGDTLTGFVIGAVAVAATVAINGWSDRRRASKLPLIKSSWFTRLARLLKRMLLAPEITDPPVLDALRAVVREVVQAALKTPVKRPARRKARPKGDPHV